MIIKNEEDIRCDLYRKVSDEYPPHRIFLKNPENISFISNAIHTDAIVKMPKEKVNPKKQKPDLLVYFVKNTQNDPVPIGTVESEKPEKVHFLEKSNEKQNKKRIITEIKFTSHSKGYSSKRKGVIKDLEKLSRRESWKKYMLYFDRSNKLDEKKEFKDIIGIMRRMSEKNEGDIEFYYMGIPKFGSEKKGQIFHYVNGILKRKEEF